MIEFDITLSRDDWENFQRCMEKELPKRIRHWSDHFLVTFFSWVIIAIIIMSLFQPGEEFHWPSAISVAIFFIAMIIYFLVYAMKFKKATLPSEKGIFVGTHHYRFDENGISTHGKGYRCQHSWDCIHRIERNNGMIMVFLDNAYAYIFNESKLDNADEFYDYINGLFQKNRGETLE